MSKLIYEFVSVRDKDGNDTMTKDHANPVHILRAVKGVCAHLVFVDRDDDYRLKTSVVEEVSIFGNTIEITTRNTVYGLEPHIREV